MAAQLNDQGLLESLQPPVDPVAGKTLEGAATAKAGTLEMDNGEPGAAGETLSDSSVCDRGPECEGVQTRYNKLLAVYNKGEAQYNEGKAQCIEGKLQYNKLEAQYKESKAQYYEINVQFNTYHDDALACCRCIECDKVGNEELRVLGENLLTRKKKLQIIKGNLQSLGRNLQTSEIDLQNLEGILMALKNRG